MALYLVTGGCGFIGSHLADALVARGDQVRILDDLSTGQYANAPQEAEIIIGTITDPATVRQVMVGVQGCFHLAAIASVPRSIEDWRGTNAVNLAGTIHVFEAARADRIPVVYASSAAVYGANPLSPLAEGATTLPSSAYGADKLACEFHARVATTIHGVPTTGFRFFNVYGPRQSPTSPYSGVISIFADRLLSDRPMTIHGDGRQVRDFVFVGDVVRHLLAAIDAPSCDPEVYNLCTGRSTTIRELAQALGDILGNEPRLEFGPPRPGDIRASVGNPMRAIERFGLSADTQLPDGLRRTVRHYEMESWF